MLRGRAADAKELYGVEDLRGANGPYGVGADSGRGHIGTEAECRLRQRRVRRRRKQDVEYRVKLKLKMRMRQLRFRRQLTVVHWKHAK